MQSTHQATKVHLTLGLESDSIEHSFRLTGSEPSWTAAIANKKHLQRLRSTVQQMSKMLDDILLDGEPAESRLQWSGINPVQLNPVQYCADWIEEVHTTTDRHKILFFAKATVSSIRIDVRLLQRILVNLLSNSIKYLPQGGDIFCRLKIDADQLTLQVQDSGIGIPLAERHRLFQSFYRASHPSCIAGTGLGLAIVKQCVDRLGGQITVNSTDWNLLHGDDSALEHRS